MGKEEGNEKSMERALEEKERIRRLSEWEKKKESVVETESTERGANSIEQYWDELEIVLETIGMDEIWKEENEPREEGEKTEKSEEMARKKVKIDEESGKKVIEVNEEEKNPRRWGRDRMEK